MGKLTLAKVRTAPPGDRFARLYGDGGGLYLRVSPTGARSWIQRITLDGKRVDLGLGPWPVVSLVEARESAFENRRKIRQGGNPLAERRKARTLTFREASQKTLEANVTRWRNGKTAANWHQQMAKRVYPKIGERPMDAIGREDVLAILVPVWTSKPEIARKLRQRIRATFEWATAHGHCESNPAGEAINGALPSQPAVRTHFRALPYQEVSAALETVEQSRASLTSKLALRFTVLTAARTGEVREARWSEVDEDAKLWVIPASRMKTGTEHRQPLSAAAMAVLSEARGIEDGSGLLFPSPVRPGLPLSDMSLTKVLRDTGLADRATVHGFRTCFRTWASERTNADHAVMELSLAHAVGSAVERAYSRSDLLDKRRRLLEQWGSFVSGDGGAKVVPLRAG